MGYYDSNHETSSEVEDNTTDTTIEGGVESEEGIIISQRQIPSHQLLNQPDHTPILGESHHGNGSEANNPIGENNHQTFCSFQSQETEIFSGSRVLNLQEPSCFPTSQHALQPQQMASMTYQHDLSCGTRNNFFVSENGQNEDNQRREGDYAKGQEEKEKEGTPEANLVPRNITPVAAANEPEDYNIDGRDNDPVSHHSIYHSRNQEETFQFGENSQHDLQNVQMPKNMTWVNQEVSKESEQVAIAEQQISPQQLVNLPADDLSDQDISSCDERDVSHSGNSLNAFENKQVEEKGKRRRNEITLEEIQSLFGMKEDDAAMVLGVSVPTIKRRCRDLGIERWPKNTMSSHHFTKKRKASSKSPSKSEYSQHVVECLDGFNKHEIARKHPNGANPSTLSNTVKKRGSSCSFVVKATYKENTVRFVSSSTTIGEIKEEVADNLELELGKKFKIKYEDSDKEWLLMTKNEHLEYARSLPDSSGSNFLRLFIIDS